MLYSQWLETPITIRNKIASIFNIEKKGATHVSDNRIEADGYFIKDIETALTREAMQKYLVTDEQDMDRLFHLLVDCIENPIQPIPLKEELPNPVIPAEIVPIIEATIKKRLGRPPRIQNNGTV